MPQFKHLAALAAAALLLTPPALAKPEKGKVFDDWMVGCEEQPDKTEKCFAQQIQTAKEGGGRVLTVAIGYLGDKGKPRMITLLPLGINLAAGAAFKVDEENQVALTLQQCTPAGCQAVAQLTDEMVKALDRGKTMSIGILPWGSDKTMLIPVPLKGFSAALKASR